LALTALGSPRSTEDYDVCYGRRRENLERLAAALGPFHPTLRGAPPELPFHLDVPTLRFGLNFTLNTDLGQMELAKSAAGRLKDLGDLEIIRALKKRSP